MNLTLPVRTLGLTDDERDQLGELLATWEAKRSKNALLTVYAEGKRGLQDFGISIPPAMKTVDAALAWPSHCVSGLARKHIFEGLSLDGNLDPFELNETFSRNDFESELIQGIESAYRYSFSLVTTTKGDTSAGEPEVMIQARDAIWSSALWDKRRRDISAALAIVAATPEQGPSEATLYTRTATIQLVKNLGTWRVTSRQQHDLGRALVEALPSNPQLSRPFGASRITREVRYLTDAAIRTMVRAETSAEFFSSPQRWVMGAREDAFADMDRWKAIMGRVLSLSVNEEGEIPTVGQFPQLSMTPHLEMYRQLAQNFCAATGLPQSHVGIFADNPASAEAMQAAEAALSDEGEYQWRLFRPRIRRIAQNAIMIRDKVKEPPAESWTVNVNWTPCRYVSPQAASDWAVKVVQADDTLKGTTVLQRRMGLSQGEIDEVRSEQRRAGATSALDRLLGNDQVPASDVAQ